MRAHWRLKPAVAVIVPVLMSALLVWQLHSIKKTLLLRNAYILESLPSRSHWVWDSISGQLSPELLSNHVLAQTETGDGVPSASKTSDVSDSKSADKEQFTKTVLGTGSPSLVVHYLWCVDGHFELTHYLSVLSVLHQLQPDSIVIHYRIKPRSDPKGYWRWLEDLQRDVVFLTLKPLHNPKHCSQTISGSMENDAQDFPDPYGVFILGNVFVSNLTRSNIVSLVRKSFQKHSDVSTKLDLSKSKVFIMGNSEPYEVSKRPGHVSISCPTVTEFNTAKKLQLTDGICVDINSYIYPEELFHRDNRFFRLARNLMYGSSHSIQIEESATPQIPNTVHVILSPSGTISPVLYVSIKSAYVNYKADHVFLHGPVEPSGKLWDRLLEKDSLKPRFIPTAPFTQYSSKHGQTVYALYTLLQRGGIVHFGDVVFMHPLSKRTVPAVASLHHSQYRMKHRLINTGVFAASAGSAFIESLLAVTRQTPTFWPEATVDDMATHINEQQPTTLHLDSLLTSHLSCDTKHCELAGGYSFIPDSLTCVRLLFNRGYQPASLDQLKELEGSARSVINKVIDAPPHG